MTLQRINALLAILLAVLAGGLGLGGVQKLRAAAARAETVDRLKAMGFAMATFHDTTKRLPPAFDRDPAGTISYPAPLHVHLLPYLNEQAVFATFSSEGKGDENALVPAFITPMDGTLGDRAGVQNFAANLRVFSAKGWKTPSAKDMPPLGSAEPGSGATMVGITHGASNTIVFATKLAYCGDGGSRYAADPASAFAAFFGQNAAHTTAHYSNPRSIYQWAPRGDECLCQPLMAQTYEAAPLVVCFADGTVRAIPGSINPGIWNAFLAPTVD